MNIIEIGSSRDDGSTFYLSKLCLKYKMNLYTIDPDEKSNRNALDVFAKFDCPANLHAILSQKKIYVAYHQLTIESSDPVKYKRLECPLFS